MVASASREEILGLLKKLEDVAKAEQFQTPLQNFCKENCQAFNAGENSLECTDIHAKYGPKHVCRRRAACLFVLEQCQHDVSRS